MCYTLVRKLPCSGHGGVHTQWFPRSPTHTPKGSDHGLNEQQTCVCVCVCVCVLSGRPANTLSPGASLIYKASNEVQQRRRARVSPRLIVCLFTFLFQLMKLPLPPNNLPYVMGGGHGWKLSTPRAKGFSKTKPTRLFKVRPFSPLYSFRNGN